MSGPIFGNSSTMTGSSGGNRHLVEFRAGRMNVVGKMVHPDTRKGLLYLYQSEDGLIHFCWKDRVSGKVEDDLIIFPDDCVFKRVDQCTTGRAFLLKFKSSTRRLFFWMQEPDSEKDKDKERCRRVNDIMNNPPSATSLNSSRGGGGSEGNDLQYMLNNMSQQQLMQLFGGVGQMGGLTTLLGSMNRSESRSSRTTTTTLSPSTTTTTTTTTTSSLSTTSSSTAATTTTSPMPTTTTIPVTPSTPGSASVTTSTPQAPKKSTTSTRQSTDDSTPQTSEGTSKVLLSDLQKFLSVLKPTDGGTIPDNTRKVDLSWSVNVDTVKHVLDDEKLTESLLEHLPAIGTPDDAKEQLGMTISSPQFQQALSSFSSALQSGQLGPVVQQFQLNQEVVDAANKGDLEQFVKSLEKAGKSTSSSVSGTATESSDVSKMDVDKKDDQDTPMDEDKK